MMRSLHVITMACVALCLLGGCPKGQGGGEEGGMMGARPVPVFLEPVMMQDYASAVTLVGDIRAAQRTVLTAEASGTVLKIAHRVGEQHAQGAGALIYIDPANYKVALTGAQAQFVQAEENLRRAKAGPRDQEIAAQEAAVAAAKAQNDQANDYLARQQELYAAGVIAETALIAAETSSEATASALKAQQEILNQLLEGTRVEDIAVAEAVVEAARSGVSSAEIALSKTHVAPPFSAVVTELYVEVGQFVAPGTPLVEVVADGAAEAWFSLPEERIGKIEPGNMVEIRCAAYPDEVFEGAIISISPQADESTRQFPTRVSLADPRLLPGMAVEGRLYLEEPQPTLMIPRDAVVTSALGEVVYAMDMSSMPPPPAGGGEGAGAPPQEGEPGAGGAEGAGGGMDMAAMMASLPSVNMLIVKTGDTVDRMAVVLEGDLQPGMMVVSRGNESLYEGAKIIPANLQGEGPGGGGPGAPGQGMPGADSAPPAGGAPDEEGAAMPPDNHAEPEGDAAGEPAPVQEGAGK